MYPLANLTETVQCNMNACVCQIGIDIVRMMLNSKLSLNMIVKIEL